MDVIRDLSQNEKVLFENLETEDIFRFDDRLFMKTDAINSENNAYDFSKHRLTEFEQDTMVAFVPSELILHERGWRDKSGI